MNTLRKHLTKFVLGCVPILVLVLAPFAGIPSASAAPVTVTINEGNVTLIGGSQTGNFPATWDLFAGDMTISFTYDATGLVDNETAQWQDHAWAELGVRDTTTTANFNPGGSGGGKGIWLATDYDEWQTLNTFNPDPPGAPSLDLDDKLILQKAGGQGEGAYNLPSVPPNPWANYGVWFDRDGVDQWQALMWGAKDGITYNTNGTYDVEITLHALDTSNGEAYMTVNGEGQGFYVLNWHNSSPDLWPAGMTFSGDMTRMQVFYGLYGYGAIHSVAFNDIQVTGCLATYTITASVTGGHGSVDPATQTVDWNTSATISISPDLGYHIASITDNGNPATIANPYVISNVTATHAVMVTFAGPQSSKQDVLNGLLALRGTVTDKQDGKKLDEAIKHLTKSLTDSWWIDEAHLQAKDGDKVFNEEKDAVNKLSELLKDKKNSLSADQTTIVKDSIVNLVAADRALAQVAINAAIDAGGDPKEIDKANEEFAKGDSELAKEKYDNAIEHYRNAWQHAQHAVK